ncbi:MAG TPA: hypothetical protein VF126_15975 [Acidobacteriaceae bacterium]
MAKPHTSIMAAILLATGWLFHSPQSSQEPSTSRTQTATKAKDTKTSAADAKSAEGPWIASRQYWSADARETDAQDESAIATNPSDALASRWGLPEDVSVSTEAHAVIATVPDPVHSHLELDFDRTLNSLISAAADNGYLASYAWLPWKMPSREPGTQEPASNRTDEPGLLIFDRRTTSGKKSVVLYMFLVGEVPGDGVNGEQMKKALRDELDLRSGLGSAFATDREDRLRVIGPQYSGSAMSLMQTINTVLAEQDRNPSNTKTQERSRSLSPIKNVGIVGGTQTEPARRILNGCSPAEEQPCPIHRERQYFSFASSLEATGLMALLDEGHYDPTRSIELREDGTAYAAGFGRAASNSKQMQAIVFPRDVSELRNAYEEGQTSSGSGEQGLPGPYLRLTTHDQGSQDTLPAFSKDKTPLSQEAQLMAISHTLTQFHTDFAYIAASNPMDVLFLAKYLRRANPDTRLVMEPDLLLQREGDDTAYIGSLSVTPYPLIWAASSPELPGQIRTFPTGAMEAYYDAASFTLGTMEASASQYETGRRDGAPPILFGYRRIGGSAVPNATASPPLWLTTVGADGYYPIAVLPTGSGLPPEAQTAHKGKRITVYPSHVWQAFCVLVLLGCVMHIVALLSANYSSPQTCDLDIEENCMRHRRALYGQVGGAMLFLMSAITAIPAVIFKAKGTPLRLDKTDLILGMTVLGFGLLAWVLAIWKTRGGVQWDAAAASSLFGISEKRLCALLYWGAIPGVLGLTALWWGLCRVSDHGENLGTFFSYRCLHPLSGVSPLTPALLLLLGWFLWAVMHARRLRLTMRSRPLMPDESNLVGEKSCATYCKSIPDLFVSDHRLKKGLLEDTTCLMISRQALRRVFRTEQKKDAYVLDLVLMLILAALTVGWILLCPVRSLEHLGLFFFGTALYELFIGLLLVPLLVITMCAAARLFLIASSLRNQLLERLERMPLRQAFTRLEGYHWVSMLRESGQLERWRDMSRSTEGIRQILNDPGLPAACHTSDLVGLKQALEEEVFELQEHVKALRDGAKPPRDGKTACQYMEEIEMKYATCAERILCCILLPHWYRRRHELMQSAVEETKLKPEPNVVLLAEEFLALRYVALIRAILAQMRYLLVFIAAALVLMMLALNGYPFQPRQEIDWFISGFFLSFSVGIVLVLAQMHRNPLLSRITSKEAHELGADFYLRVATFGVVPLLTWLATLYPTIGNKLYALLKPGLEFMK